MRLTSARAEDSAAQGDIRVNDVIDGVQQSAKVAMAKSGDFVVTWQSEIPGNGDDIRARRFDARGVPQGEEFGVNSVTLGNQNAPAIAMDARGGFVVVWQSFVTTHYVIRARRFSAIGVANSEEIAVDARPREGHNAPVVAMSPDGRFVAVWESSLQGSYEIRARRFDARGKTQGGELAVNAVTQSSQRFSCIAMDEQGNFVVVWRSNVEGNFELRARRFTAAGVPVGGDVEVTASGVGDRLAPAVAMDAKGNFVVVWENSLGRAFEIRARRFSAAGDALGDEFRVARGTAGSQFAPAVAMNPAGDIVIVWHAEVQRPRGGGSKITARAFAANGAARGPEFAIDAFTDGTHKGADVVLGAGGEFVVSWHGYTGESWDVFARQSRLTLGPPRSARQLTRETPSKPQAEMHGE